MHSHPPYQKEDQSFFTKNSSTTSSISFGKVLKKDQIKNSFLAQNNHDYIQQSFQEKCSISLFSIFKQYQTDPCSDYFTTCYDNTPRIVKLANQNYGEYIQSISEQDFHNKLRQNSQNSYKIGRIPSLLRKLELMQTNTNEQQTNYKVQRKDNFKSENNQINDRTFSFQKCLSIINSKQRKNQNLKQSQIHQISQLGLQSQLHQVGLQSKIKIQKQLSQIKEYPKKQIIENIKDRNNPEKTKCQSLSFNNEKLKKSQGMIKGLQFSKKLKKKKFNYKDETYKYNTDNSSSKFTQNLIKTTEFKI